MHLCSLTALLISWNQEVCLLQDFFFFLFLSLDSRDPLMLICYSSWLLSFFVTLCFWKVSALLLVYYLCCFCFIKPQLFIICSNICTSAHWSEVTALLIIWNQEVWLLKDFSFFLFSSLDSRDPLMLICYSSWLLSFFVCYFILLKSLCFAACLLFVLFLLY